MTTPEPRWREPMPTMEAPAASATPVRAAWRSSRAVIRWVSLPAGPAWLRGCGVTCDLQVTTGVRPNASAAYDVADAPPARPRQRAADAARARPGAGRGSLEPP